MKLILTSLTVLLIVSSCNSQEEKITVNSSHSIQENDFQSEEIQQGTGIMNDQQTIKVEGSHEINTPYKDYLVGKTNFSKDPGFVKVSSEHSSKEIYLRTQVYEAFLEMNEAALKEGIHLKIISGARSFEHQKNIWDRKWKSSKIQDPKQRALEILRFSSMPMSSRHHWGTDFDLNNLENDYFESGEGLKIYNWLSKNASKYGFCQVYSDKKTDSRKGYELEKWHWSYMPLSSQVLERYKKQINIKDFTGFEGSETAESIDIIKNYVNGIADCK